MSNLHLKQKKDPILGLVTQIKRNKNFYCIEIIIIWLILLNPRFETQETLIASYFLKNLTNYFIIASYFCQKVLHCKYGHLSEIIIMLWMNLSCVQERTLNLKRNYLVQSHHFILKRLIRTLLNVKRFKRYQYPTIVF